MTVPSPSTGVAARKAALMALTAINDGAWSTVAVNRAIDTLHDARDRRFAAHITYETVRWSGSIDKAIEAVSVRPLHQIEPALLNVLRLGVAQLLVSRVPARAAVDTSVTLAKQQTPKQRRAAAGGFVNGILRAIAKHGSGFAWLVDENADLTTKLSLTTGHPAWIVDALRERFDDNEVAAFLAANNDAPGVTLRAVAPRETVLEMLAAHGVDATPGRHERAIRTKQFDPSRAQLITDGSVVVQDEASMQVVDALDVTAGHRVLDLCAGPGGKALDIAQRVGPDGALVAIELHDARATMIRELATRLNFPVDVRVGDATNPPLHPEDLFDRVLVDAPCSGLGTSRRRPEVRWRKQPGDVDALAKLQTDLLEAAWRHTKPSGKLTYAVCTYTREETVAVRDAFRAAHPEAILVASKQLLPHVDDTDGMFFATWQRP